MLLCVVFVSGCSNLRADVESGKLSGTILVWHSWPEPESELIEQLLIEFMAVHPETTIVTEYIPKELLEEEFVEHFAAGLGPDLLIGAELWLLNDLAGQDLLVDLSAYDQTYDELLNHSIDALRIEDALYGVPFAAYTPVLFYNKRMVETPARTLSELLEHAQAGNVISLPTNFHISYWGVRAFGGSLYDDETGEVHSDPAFVAWLEWLAQAQRIPTVFLSPDYGELRQVFASGQSAYFVGDSIDLPVLRAALGDDQVGVGLLPRVDGAEEGEGALEGSMLLDNGFAPGSFLDLEVITVSTISAHKELCLALIDFFINQTHQRELAQRDLGHIPMNRYVRFDPRFSATESTLVRQSTTAVSIPLPIMDQLLTLAEVSTEIHVQVLEGVVEPDEAVQALPQRVSEALDAAAGNAP